MPKLLRQNVGGIDYNMVGCALRASCSTAAATAAKTAVLTDGDILADGMLVAVQFTEGNTAAPLILTVGGVTAYVYDFHGQNIGGNVWQAGNVVTFLYTHEKFFLLNYENFSYHDNDSQDADANTLTAPGVYSVNVQNPANQHLDIEPVNGWCAIFVTNMDSNPNVVQQQLIDFIGRRWTRVLVDNNWTPWLSDFSYHNDNSFTVDANALNTPGVYSIVTQPGTEAQYHVPKAGWCTIYVSRFDNNPDAVQQLLIDYTGQVWVRLGGSTSSWSEWKVLTLTITSTVVPSATPADLSAAIANMLDVLNVQSLYNGSYIINCTYGTYFETNMTAIIHGSTILVRGSTMGWDGVSARDDHLFTASKYIGENWAVKIY